MAPRVFRVSRRSKWSRRVSACKKVDLLPRLEERVFQQHEAASVECQVFGVADPEILKNIESTLTIIRDQDRDGLTALRIAQLHERAPMEIQRAVEPFATGRKNWLFSGSDRGGRTLATLGSLTATCELGGVNPWVYLKDVLTLLPTTPLDQLATLLPDAAE